MNAAVALARDPAHQVVEWCSVAAIARANELYECLALDWSTVEGDQS